MLRVIQHPPPRTMFSGDTSSGYSQPPNVKVPYGRPQEHARLPPQAISQIYKSCTNLFLTRRLPEALAALQPAVSDPTASLRQCPRALRVKFWGLYLAILDAAAKVGASEGKATWGQKEWPELVGKIRSGDVWEEANCTYGGEGRVDAEVVVTLATLLLSHCHDQGITQKRIEAWMGAAPSALYQDEDPKSILQRSKITEIYVLHVLPRVGEWEYAREFVQMSPDIDEDQKEQFYTTLESLQKDREEMELQSHELERQREEELELERKNEQEQRKAKTSRAPSTSSRTSRRRGSSVKPVEKATLSDESATEAMVKKRLAIAKENAKRTTAGVVPRATGRIGRSSSLITSTTAVLSKLQRHLTASSGPFSMLQTIIMLAVIAWMTNNKRMREKIRRFLLMCWIKMVRTIGMGTKVTYI